MHEYDTVLKTLLQHSCNSIIEQITGTSIVRWHNVELPKVEQVRVDLLGESVNEELIHIELQSANDSSMALRMAGVLAARLSPIRALSPSNCHLRRSC